MGFIHAFLANKMQMADMGKHRQNNHKMFTCFVQSSPLFFSLIRGTHFAVLIVLCLVPACAVPRGYGLVYCAFM